MIRRPRAGVPIEGDLRRWGVLLLAVLGLGVWLQVKGGTKTEDLAGSVVTGVALAFLIPLILASRIEQRLLRDVFQTVHGFFLPDELRPELAWITTQRLVQKEYSWTLELSETDDEDVVNLCVTMEGRIVNVGGLPERVHLNFGAVDRMVGLPTRILELSYEIEGKVVKADIASAAEAFDKLRPPMPLVPFSLPLKRNGDCRYWFKFETARRSNDSLVSVMNFWTLSPKVIIKNGTNDLDYKVTFVHPVSTIRPVEGPSGHFRLDASLMPQQSIVVSWWPERRFEELLEARAAEARQLAIG